MKRNTVHLTDIQGYAQLVIEATLGVTSMVEAMHHTILQLPLPLAKPGPKSVKGVHGVIYTVLQRSSGLVYGVIRRVTVVVGQGVDGALNHLHPERDPINSSGAREAMISIVNGVFGDRMAAANNPLTITMGFRQAGQPLALTRKSLASAIATPSGKILVLLHGHCMSELQWCRNGHDHGAALAAANGYSPMYLRYNTGLHISENGRLLADQLESLVREWPVAVQELCIFGYSMGGLLARSAFYYGEQAHHSWPQLVQKMLFVGTPHHGSMLEQAGNMVEKALEISPYSHALSRLGKIRSAGTTDLRHGNLIDEDWSGHDRFAHARDQRQISQLPRQVKCYAIAAVIAREHGELRAQLIGDGLVPLKSALGVHRNARRALHLPADRQQVFYGMGHLGLLDSQAVCAQLQDWMAQR